MVWAEKGTPHLPNELQGQADVLHVTHSHRFKKLHTQTQFIVIVKNI